VLDWIPNAGSSNASAVAALFESKKPARFSEGSRACVQVNE